MAKPRGTEELGGKPPPSLSVVPVTLGRPAGNRVVGVGRAPSSCGGGGVTCKEEGRVGGRSWAGQPGTTLDWLQVGPPVLQGRCHCFERLELLFNWNVLIFAFLKTDFIHTIWQHKMDFGGLVLFIRKSSLILVSSHTFHK